MRTTRLHSTGIQVASIFWGLRLFPFGRLVLPSGFISRPFGWLHFVAGANGPQVKEALPA